MKAKLNLLTTTLIAAGLLALPFCALTAQAQDASAPAASASPAKTHSSGTISAVDTSGKTVTVDNKKDGSVTYTVTDSTKITGADGSTATLADLKTGDHVRVSFKTGDDGKTELVSIKVGTGKKKKDQ